MDNIQEIRIDQVPTKNKWRFIPLYKLLPTGYEMWQIGFDGKHYYEIYNEHGLISKQRADPEVNHVSLLRKHCIDKIKIGYVSSINNIPQVKAMKGNKYTGNNINSWPVYTQPKLEGIRVLSQRNNNAIIMKSYLGTVYSHLTHITKELLEFSYYLPQGTTIDGELYNHSMDFSAIVSTVKTTKTKHPKLENIQYWIFDIIYEDHEGAPYESRCTILINAFHRYLEDKNNVLPSVFGIVPTSIARNHQEILQQHNNHVFCGYEGIIIRKISNGAPPGSKKYNQCLYRSAKCSNFLKYKEFVDEEFTIIGFNNEEYLVKDEKNKEFYVRMKGNNQIEDNAIGELLTVRYLAKNIDGIPINPIGIVIRNYE